MVPCYLQITHCVHSALVCFKMTTSNFTHLYLVSINVAPCSLHDLSTASKKEAIHGMLMSTYTKIFLQFPHKFWFATEVCLFFSYRLHLNLNPDIPSLRWQFMRTLNEVVIQFGKAWIIQISSRDQE